MFTIRMMHDIHALSNATLIMKLVYAQANE